MIVVEGPDGAGKSTFVQKLADRLEMDIAVKAVDHDMSGLTDIKTYVEQTLARDFHSLIYDRFALISGCIYDPVYSGMEGVNRDFQDFEWLQRMQTRFLFEIDPVIIWCLPPLKTVMKNLYGDTLNREVASNLEKLRAIYWLYHSRTSLEPSPVTYDYTKDSLKQVFEEVEIKLEERDG